jgi:hypothetical protein
MSFQQLFSTWITVFFVKSGLTLSQEEVAKETPRFSALFQEFFEFICTFSSHELEFLREPHEFSPLTSFAPISRISRVEVYLQMFDNFLIFSDFALKNIHIIDANTLYEGLKTQKNKFLKAYNPFKKVNFSIGGYGYRCICCEVYVNFNEIVNILKFNAAYYAEPYEPEPNEIDLEDELFPKDCFLAVRNQKVRGKRRDYETYTFNKGMKKLDREHPKLKERKNKKSRDYKV